MLLKPKLTIFPLSYYPSTFYNYLLYLGYADGATDPIDFPIAPRFSTEKLLKQVGMNVSYSKHFSYCMISITTEPIGFPILDQLDVGPVMV